MKTILFVAALSVSGIALAQTTPPMETPGTPADTPTTVAPGNQNPEEDARGIAVVSDPAVAPAGANQPVTAPPGATVVPAANASAVFATEPTPAEDYPPCTREVTDNCVQTYERGVGPD